MEKNESTDLTKNILYIPGIVSVNGYSETVTLKKYLREYFDTRKSKFVLEPPRIVKREDIDKGTINPEIVFIGDDRFVDKNKKEMDAFLENEEQK